MKLASAFSAGCLTFSAVQAFPNTSFARAKPSFVTVLQVTQNAPPLLETSEESNRGFFGKIFHRNTKLEKQLKVKAQEIKAKATDHLIRLEENLEQAIQQETNDIINCVALDVLTLVEGHWDFSIATTNQADTKSIMEGRINDIANDLIEMGMTGDENRGDIQEELRNSRLKIKQTFDGSVDYPLRIQQEVFLGQRRVIQVFGQLQFDLLDRNVVYSVDELVVLGTTVDLDEIIMIAAPEEEKVNLTAVKTENHDEAAKEALMQEISSTLETEGAVRREAELDAEEVFECLYC
ncbi:expressed unknown protein [Seminavis robusta]|uniref:Uncharacterized protein n=1 Tax=Seminavis robusta TaxID=568900 RepID=A0A9N8DQR0_9STRA|nr:expressed unknown protein [Seminavis robusta]|eukprot:Sro280_g107100.1 n/a (293) ;mRNA; r:63220-64098